jgi:hypothetical protein
MLRNALARRVGEEGVEASGRSSMIRNELIKHQPGEIMFSGRTYWSNSSLVR